MTRDKLVEGEREKEGLDEVAEGMVWRMESRLKRTFGGTSSGSILAVREWP